MAPERWYYAKLFDPKPGTWEFNVAWNYAPLPWAPKSDIWVPSCAFCGAVQAWALKRSDCDPTNTVICEACMDEEEQSEAMIDAWERKRLA